MIFISTGGCKKEPATEFGKAIYNELGFGIELSGGAYDPDFRSKILELASQTKVTLHNYYPVPEHPFVINLASDSCDLRTRSIEHVKSALQLSSEIGSPVYACHAGFLVDPPPAALGKKFSTLPISSKEEALLRFADAVCMLTELGQYYGVQLLIENNVLTKSNLETFGCNPLLLTTAEEIKEFSKHTGLETFLLLDLAHLKVSALTHNLSVKNQLENMTPFISGYHFSENDGLADTNDPIGKDPWFADLLVDDIEYNVAEIYTQDLSLLGEQHRLISSLLTRANKS